MKTAIQEPEIILKYKCGKIQVRLAFLKSDLIEKQKNLNTINGYNLL